MPLKIIIQWKIMLDYIKFSKLNEFYIKEILSISFFNIQYYSQRNVFANLKYLNGCVTYHNK